MTSTSRVPKGPVQVEFRLGGEGAGRATIDAEIIQDFPTDGGEGTIWRLRAYPMDLGTRTRVRDYVLTHRRGEDRPVPRPGAQSKSYPCVSA